MIVTHQPGISVVVHKRIERRRGVAERVSGADRRIDLTPFLGEGSSVRVRKHIREPAGSFNITLSDKIDSVQQGGRKGTLDSLYAALEPMDYVEIRAARNPHLYVGRGLKENLPIVMRGFVTDVRRNETVGADGRPRRTVTIAGQDYGKIPQIVVLFFRADYAAANYWLSSFPLHVLTGFDVSAMSAEDWIGRVVESILNAWLREMTSFTKIQGLIPFFGLDSSVSKGKVAPLGMQHFRGTMWQFILDWADTPWNEVFIEDREDGPVVVYRPNPMLDADGRSPQGVKTPRMDLAVRAADIVSSDLGRTDTNVANFYWVEAPRTMLLSAGELNIQSLASGRLTVLDVLNCDPRLYGLRQMSAQTNQLDSTARRLQTDLTPDEETKHNQNQIDWIAERRELLKRMNVDNAVFESGSLVVKGDERFKPGRYVDIIRGNLRSQAYVPCVAHDYVPFRGFTSTLTIERGTGFLERTKAQGRPYLGEMTGGPYDE